MKVKAFVLALMLFGALCFSAHVVPDARAAGPGQENQTQCMYCKSYAYGHCSATGANKSPSGKHKHQSDGKHCVWCGAKSQGYCSIAPDNKHAK